MHPSLKELYKDHQGKESDKWSLYLEEWDRLFSTIHVSPINLLEIGVQNGGSLEIWGKFFQNAEKIIGCDIDENCSCLNFDDTRISIVIGDANSDATQGEILSKCSAFDVIIDDGSHNSGDIIRSFARYFSSLKDGGIYITEDLHASYWTDFEGGLHNPLSAISFYKRLADIVNFEHWRNGQPPQRILDGFSTHLGIQTEQIDLEKVHSVEFINSLCIIRKGDRKTNELGPRVIAGTESCVTESRQQFNNTSIQDMEVRIENDAALDVFNLITEVENLKLHSAALDLSIHQLGGQIQSQNEELASKNEQIASLSKLASDQNEKITTLDDEILMHKGIEQSLSEIVDTQRQTIEGLEKSLLAASTQSQQLEDEVVYYASSKSWKYTRPFRRLYGFLRRLVR